MAMRLSGLISGMDTDSVIQQLVQAKSTKVNKAKKEQTKLEWKTDAWKELNKKLKSFQSKYLNNMRFASDYAKKTTKASNSNAVSVITGSGAMDSVQSLDINELAKTAYMTGGKIEMPYGQGGDVTALTTMSQLGITEGAAFQVKKGGETTMINVDASTTISDVLNQLKEAGLNASFDANQKRLFISGKESGAAENFSITAANGAGARAMGVLGLSTGSSRVTGASITKTGGGIADKTTTLRDLGITAATTFMAANNAGNSGDSLGIIHLDPDETIENVLEKLKENGFEAQFDETTGRISMSGVNGFVIGRDATVGSQDALEKLGLAENQTTRVDDSGERYAVMIKGQDARITLNGATFTSKNNVFEVNGLTITAQEVASNITLTTETDTDGIYDMVKNFIKDYSELVNEMDKLYNADSTKGYEPLTDEEKESMSEAEIEKWETKIKDSLLRRDDNLYKVNNSLQTIMAEGFNVNGKQMYLSNFGINTLGYFAAEDNERHAYHIDGNADDEDTSANEDKLRQMITADPDAVVSFFTQLTQKMYTKMNELSTSVEDYRSFGNFYDDKKMKTDYREYTSKISDLEKKLADYEDKWYSKFAAMETAMAKLQESTSAITSLLGGS
ncbi:MAG: flagellar filament capping protein FliD [Candidatus Gastranaerophilales bacterium]|nr:flagellar filament capping protein FliD [Candidatus Gastranaerophilales bacterium]